MHVSKEITVNYHGENVRIDINTGDKDAPFTVFLPGEEGRVILHAEAGEDGEKIWRENGAITERAKELGQLIGAGIED